MLRLPGRGRPLFEFASPGGEEKHDKPDDAEQNGEYDDQHEAFEVQVDARGSCEGEPVAFFLDRDAATFADDSDPADPCDVHARQITEVIQPIIYRQVTYGGVGLACRRR